MKTLRLVMACGVLIGLISCANPDGKHDEIDGADSLFSDSIANDSATWGDTTMTTDSLASPSFP